MVKQYEAADFDACSQTAAEIAAKFGDKKVLELYQTLCKVFSDPAKMHVLAHKSEFLSGYWERHGTPLQARLFGNVRTVAEWSSRLAPLANSLANSAPARVINEQLFGIDRRRDLPSWARQTLRRRLAGRPPIKGGPANTRAVLFADTFTNYSDPEIGLAALQVLEAAGIGTDVVPHGCCGRPLISQGFLPEARQLAFDNANALFDVATRGDAIVFLEPSCLSAMKEDAPALLRGAARERAQVVADACVLFEDYVERECRDGRATLRVRPGPGKILLHPHCHQRSMGLASSARALLSRIPSATVIDLDAGCCGMAGSFGYTRDHYEVSKAIGERKLLPAARALGAGEVLVAAGTSCRHQVADLAGVTAVHPAVLLQSLLEETR